MEGRKEKGSLVSGGHQAELIACAWAAPGLAGLGCVLPARPLGPALVCDAWAV
jgi:hypothetical protein